MLELQGLTKDFGAVRAVDDVSLRVEPGELLTLLGPSGCGKTTTLRLVAGFETATAGRIVLAGRDVTRLRARERGVGMVFQNYALFPHLNVFENVAFGLKARGVAKAQVAARVEAALARVELAGYAERRVQQLSGGQQQRVALARALAPEPPLLLLDEPLSNLDATLRERTRTELRTLLKQVGITALFVTHDQEEAFALADRIAVMGGGRLQQLGTPETLYARPANAFVAGFIGRANLLPARVVEAVGDAVACTLEGAGAAGAGPAVWRGVAAAPVPAVGAAVRLLVRPEALRLRRAEGGGGEAWVRGVVRDRRFAGAATFYTVAAAGGELLVQGEAGWAEPGEAVLLAPAEDAAVRVFPAEAMAAAEAPSAAEPTSPDPRPPPAEAARP
jgi:iron(III) transport system ATP-binding protein